MSSSSMQQRPRHSAHGRPSRRPKSWLQPTEEWTFAELDTEIQRFVRHISLTPQERTQREQAVEHVRALCSKCLPHCTVVVVGSFAFDLGLPSSDVDLSLQGVEGDPAVALQHLEEALRASGVVADVELILARVPVLKVSFQSGVQVDVNASFSSSLIDTITRVRHFVTVHPQARAIILLTKCLLRQWGLANVFAGGLSSTSVYLLVERFFALKDKASHAGESGDLSRLVAPDASPCLTPRSESSWGPTASEESHTSSSDRVAPMTSTLFVDFLEHCSSEWYMYGFKLFDPSDATNEVSRGTKRVLEIQALMAHTRSSLLVVTKGFKPQGAPVSQLSAVVADPRASQRASNPATTSIRVGNKFVRN